MQNAAASLSNKLNIMYKLSPNFFIQLYIEQEAHCTLCSWINDSKYSKYSFRRRGHFVGPRWQTIVVSGVGMNHYILEFKIIEREEFHCLASCLRMFISSSTLLTFHFYYLDSGYLIRCSIVIHSSLSLNIQTLIDIKQSVLLF